MTDRSPLPFSPLIVGSAVAAVVVGAGVFALSTRWRADGELTEAYAEVDYQSAHAGIAERRVEVAEQAVEIKRAYYLEREVLAPHERALIEARDRFDAAREEALRLRHIAQARADRLQQKIDRALKRAKREARRRNNLVAIKAVNDALALNSKQPGALHMRAVLHLREGDADAAIADCDAALAQEPDLVDAFVTRGSARRAKGDTPGAIADYGRALKKDPNDLEALNNRGFVLAKSGRDAEAIRDYSRALRRDPTSVETYVNRAQARTRLGDRKGAIGDLDRALKLLGTAGKGSSDAARSLERRRRSLTK